MKSYKLTLEDNISSEGIMFSASTVYDATNHVNGLGLDWERCYLFDLETNENVAWAEKESSELWWEYSHDFRYD